MLERFEAHSPRACSTYAPLPHAFDSKFIISVSFIPILPGETRSFSSETIGLPVRGMPSAQLVTCLQVAFGISNAWKCVGFRTRNANDQLGGFIPLSVASVSPALLSQTANPVEILYRYDSHKECPSNQSESDFASLRGLLDALEQESQLSKFDIAVLRAQWAEWKNLEDGKLRFSWKQLLTDPNVSFSMKKDQMRQWLLDPFGALQVPNVPLQRSSISPLLTETQFYQLPKSNPARGSRTLSPDCLTKTQDMIHEKIVQLAHTVFSPAVQTELLSEAAEYRQRKSIREPIQPHRFDQNVNSSLIDNEWRQEESDIPIPIMEELQLELLNKIDQLVNELELPEEDGLYLIRLVLAESEVILKVMQLDKKCPNQGQLDNALKQLIQLGSLPKSNAPVKGTKSMKTGQRKVRIHFSLEKWKEAYRILERLYDDEKLTTMELELLGLLIQQRYHPVLRAIEAFRSDYDETILCKRLRVLIHNVTGETKAETQTHSNIFKDGANTIPIAPSPLYEACRPPSIPWWQHLDHLVHNWHSRGSLSPDQHQMITSLLVEKHNLLESAYEVYLSDQDDAELLDTLQRIAKLQLQAYESASCANFNRLLDDYCAESIQEHDRNRLKQLFARKHQLTRAAFQLFQSEGQIDDFMSALFRIVRLTFHPKTRSRLVQVVEEMLERQLIQSHEADGLIRLYVEKNDALTAANEVFEMDGDEKDLIETLLLVVKHAGLGDPSLESQNTVANPAETSDFHDNCAFDTNHVERVMVHVSKSDGQTQQEPESESVQVQRESESVQVVTKKSKKSKKKRKKKTGVTELRVESTMESLDCKGGGEMSESFEEEEKMNTVKAAEVEVEVEERKV
uniref:Uncharacterized protein AlNc14C80G5256 n=1 Tax=Albugo laibachii Nc14 TaxID=890382 RepID=F0WF62_9STRA|nr:conserved hypothetical protein [Albugo laibachii Nc14]|eukprot:CCA19844.1 conserved hypothetical protein [Albugo laibachii Nc14]